jgi:hypothetical protein
MRDFFPLVPLPGASSRIYISIILNSFIVSSNRNGYFPFLKLNYLLMLVIMTVGYIFIYQTKGTNCYCLLPQRLHTFNIATVYC